jgi:Icc-related predicted phosphoesterase
MKIRRISDSIAKNYRLRICHASDTHGGIPRLHGKYDCVVHSGDFFPNSPAVMSGNKVQEAVFQMQWLQNNVKELKQQLQGHTIFFTFGNHDFADPDMVVNFLNSEGVAAINLHDKVVNHMGVNFYGFPYIPAIGGNIWNYERELPEMTTEIDKMVEVLNQTHVDVLVCHAPIYKCLDVSYSNQILGNTAMVNALDYKINKDMMPMAYLCGHIHESHGLTVRNGILVSNAAVTYQIIEV